VTLGKAHGILFGIFLAALVVQMVVVALAFQANAITANDASALIVTLFTIYAVPLGVVFGGVFAKETYKRQRATTPVSSKSVVWSAVVVSVLWNLTMTWRSLRFGYAVYHPAVNDNVDQLSYFLETISTTSSFLIAGALAFFFTRA
jgi:hypothetical protein